MTLTPAQFNILATKEDLKDLVSKDKFDEKMNQVLTAIDGLAKSVNDFKTELASNQGAHDRLSDDITDHKIRIEKLELKSA